MQRARLLAGATPRSTPTSMRRPGSSALWRSVHRLDDGVSAGHGRPSCRPGEVPATIPGTSPIARSVRRYPERVQTLRQKARSAVSLLVDLAGTLAVAGATAHGGWGGAHRAPAGGGCGR